MSYTNDADIIVSDIAVPFVAEIEASMPILMNGNKTFDKTLVGGNGTSMRVIIPGYGASPTTGPAVNPANLGYVSGEISVSLVQRNVAVGLTQVQQSLRLSNFAEQVAQPYGWKLGADIQSIAADTLLLAADTATVIPLVSGAASATFTDISKSIAAIKAARSVGEHFGAVSNGMASLIMNSGIQFFNPNTDVSRMFLIGELGKFRSVMFYETPDISTLVTGDRAASTPANLRLKSNVTVAGATSITLDVSGGTLTGTIATGEMVYLSGVKAVTVFGKAITTNYAFVAQEDATAAGDELVIKVKPLYFAGQGPLQNVSVAQLTAHTAASFGLKASTTYERGLIWNKNAFVYASAVLKPLAMVKSNQANGEALQVLVQTGTDILGGQDVIRWDVLTGFQLARSNWVSTVLSEVA